MSRPGNPRILVARGLDSWLVGWLAVIVWIGVVIADRAGLTLGPNLTSTVYWAGAIITAAHFGLSYHLAYSEGAPALRKRPFALVIGPALLAVTLPNPIARDPADPGPGLRELAVNIAARARSAGGYVDCLAVRTRL